MDATPIFTAYLARNRGPVPGDPEARQTPDYGVLARAEAENIDLSLTFRAGSAYCCYEPGCHLALYEGKRWDRLRRELSTIGMAPVPRLVLRRVVVVEGGAMFFDFRRPEPSPRGRAWYAFAPVSARRSECVILEGEAPTGK